MARNKRNGKEELKGNSQSCAAFSPSYIYSFSPIPLPSRIFSCWEVTSFFYGGHCAGTCMYSSPQTQLHSLVSLLGRKKTKTRTKTFYPCKLILAGLRIKWARSTEENQIYLPMYRGSTWQRQSSKMRYKYHHELRRG